MGKGSKARPVSKGYGNEYDRIFGKRCIRHRKAECSVCNPKPKAETPPWLHEHLTRMPGNSRSG